MADIIQQIREMQEKMVELKDLISKRINLVTQLSEIDRQIKRVLDMETDTDLDENPGRWSHPNTGTDAYCMTEVMKGKEMMHRNEILEALKEEEHDISLQSVSYYLTNFKCFQNVRRGYWVYIAS